MDPALVMAREQVSKSRTDHNPGHVLADEPRHLPGGDLTKRCARLGEYDSIGEQIHLDRAEIAQNADHCTSVPVTVTLTTYPHSLLTIPEP
jgi:hypothetical protein